mmetsp:Transcript_42637/g.83613  ORF Transcript_42637/g.83613 Transcript_42637/m.83613 type:complete len:234 (+) Transcript_42637:178-879(+)
MMKNSLHQQSQSHGSPLSDLPLHTLPSRLNRPSMPSRGDRWTEQLHGADLTTRLCSLPLPRTETKGNAKSSWLSERLKAQHSTVVRHAPKGRRRLTVVSTARRRRGRRQRLFSGITNLLQRTRQLQMRLWRLRSTSPTRSTVTCPLVRRWKMEPLQVTQKRSEHTAHGRPESRRCPERPGLPLPCQQGGTAEAGPPGVSISAPRQQVPRQARTNWPLAPSTQHPEWTPPNLEV